MEGTLLSRTQHTCGSTQTGGTFVPWRERGDSTQKEELEEGVSRVWTRVRAGHRKGSVNTPVGSRGLGLVRREDHTQGRRKTTAGGRLQQEEDYSRGKTTAGGRLQQGDTYTHSSGCQWMQWMQWM